MLKKYLEYENEILKLIFFYFPSSNLSNTFFAAVIPFIDAGNPA